MPRKAIAIPVIAGLVVVTSSLSWSLFASIPASDEIPSLTSSLEVPNPPFPLPPDPASDHVGFTLQVGEHRTDFRVFATFVLPEQEVTVTVAKGREGMRLLASANGGELRALGPTSWGWRAPASSGLYPLQFRDGETQEAVEINAFVMVPYNGARTLNGYTIGSYQARPLHDLASYQRPAGLVEVFPRLLDVQVSPHFKLGQFVCKQQSGYPKYLVLREPLLLKLEALLAKVQEHGIEARTFRVMSGFRTPYYNARIGNETTYSRHGYGDAADIMVDANGDRQMDDLDGNGRVDVGDARFLLKLAEEVQVVHDDTNLVGGLGLYGQRRNHGPFIHVDTRGFEARW